MVKGTLKLVQKIHCVSRKVYNVLLNYSLTPQSSHFPYETYTALKQFRKDFLRALLSFS